MEEETVPKPYSPLTETRSLFNNPKMSDVRFLVDGQTVYGHKQTLGLGSPVFERMFFGELKEKRDVIEIKDLTLVGFKNALRYVYGFPIDFKLSVLYESYLAADKYLLHHFNEAFFEYIKGRLNAETSCLIYDQLVKIQKEEISLDSVRALIVVGGEKVFKSDYFKRIDKETLVELLSLSGLSIAEFGLLEAVSKWVDCEVQRQGLPVDDENRRKVFEPIKSYILFTALKPERIANCEEIAELLTKEERGSLLLHLMNKENPLTFEVKTPRRASTYVACRVFVSDPCPNHFFNSENVYLSVNRRVAIRTLHSAYPEEVNLTLKILDPKGVDLGLKMERLVKDGKRCFSFNPPFHVEPNSKYTLQVTGFNALTERGELSKQAQLNYKGYIIFNLSFPFPFNHCVRGLEFLATD